MFRRTVREMLPNLACGCGSLTRVFSLGIAGIAIGSEMSGGVSDVVIEDLVGTGEMGIDVKSGKGRGGYIRNGTRTPPARPRPLGCSC